MFDPEEELEAEMDDNASESTSDGEDDDDDTTISISDPEEEDGVGNHDGGRAREASLVFYIEPDECSSSNEEQQDETLTAKSVVQNSVGGIKKVNTVVRAIYEDEDVSLLRSVLCSPLGRMRSVSMMSDSPQPPTQPVHAHHMPKRPNSLVVDDGGGRAREASPVFYIEPDEYLSSNEEQQDKTLTAKSVQSIEQNSVSGIKKVNTVVGAIYEDEDVSLLRSVLCSPLGRMRSISVMSASPPPPSQPAHARSLLRGRMRKTAIPLLSAVVRLKRHRDFNKSALI